MGNTLRTIVVGFLAGLAGAFVFYKFQQRNDHKDQSAASYSTASYDPANYQPLVSTSTATPSFAPVDFSEGAARAIPSVVYINSITESGSSYSYWDMLLGNGGQQTQVSSGSGVIFTSDGYIVTNNHVVEYAERIQVIYNKKVYDAELIGTDPSTDLGVLKIKETNLPAATLGSSRALAVGEWVIAVGNPFSLSSTVTAGIVSAKGRRINIVEDKFPIESFIQTDAAINPGNSGGALVNKNGELVGINTAILSRTGSYTGYAFAVPVDIAKKVVNDLIKFGIVQKAFAGATVNDYDYQTAAKYNLPAVKDFNGVIVIGLDKESPAKDAGLQPGDIIIRIDNADVNSKAEYEEALSYHYPGDKLNVTYLRDGKSTNTTVSLVNKIGSTALIKRNIIVDSPLGANLEAVEYGVKVSKIKDGILRRLNVPENYTIISINRQRIRDPKDVVDFFTKYKGRAELYGINSAKQELQLRFILP
jgi:serine protease Do